MSKQVKQTNEELVALIQAGKKHLETLLLTRNMGLVRRVAHAYKFPGVEYADREQDGCMGLLASIPSYDEAKGAFSTHATRWIKAYVIREGNEQANAIHIPGNVLVKKVKMLKYIQERKAFAGIIPSHEEIAINLDMSITDVKEILSAHAAGAPTSLDKTIEGGEGETMMVADIVGGAKLEDNFDDRISAIRAYLDELPRTEQEILTRVLGLNGESGESFRDLDGKIKGPNGQYLSFTTVNKYYLESIEYIKARCAGRAVVYKAVNKPKAQRKDASKRDIIVAIAPSIGQAFVTADISLSQEAHAQVVEKLHMFNDASKVMSAEDVRVFQYRLGVKLEDVDTIMAKVKGDVSKMGHNVVLEEVA